MYVPDDTIVAVSSPRVGCGSAGKNIIRVSGPRAFETSAKIVQLSAAIDTSGIVMGKIKLTGLEVEAMVYVFKEPNSYTGQDMAEIHFFAAGAVCEKILGMFAEAARPAGPGEFTLRGYLNGKMDLSQAEAVAEIVAGVNNFQIAAAERLLAGRLSEKIAHIREGILNILSLIEAGLDFSTEQIEFISKDKATELIDAQLRSLREILSAGIRYEQMLEMPSVGLAGVVNAGKSSLLNCLIGRQRGLVSGAGATTRDILTGTAKLGDVECAVFDCAGLTNKTQKDLLEELTQAAAVSALKTAQLVVFCVAADKDNYDEDIAVRKLIECENIIPAATKCDLVEQITLDDKLRCIGEIFGLEAVPTSSVKPGGINKLRDILCKQVLEIQTGGIEGGEQFSINQRHRQSVEQAADNLIYAADEIRTGNDETAAMFLRIACENLGNFEGTGTDEKILDNIFGRFCIGK